MKYIKSLVFALFLLPVAAFGAQNDFMVAAQLLAAARNADIAQVQALVNNGADINFVDSTGLSIVCTALMNDDLRAAQILQMYGADASQCDRQIKKYKSKTRQEKTGGLFSGLSSAQSLTLTAAGAAVVVGGLLLFTDVFDPGNKNSHSGGDGNRPGGDNGGGSDDGGSTAAFELPYGPAMPNAESEKENFVNNLNYYSPSVDGILKDNFAFMSNSQYQNYLLLMKGYAPLARGYLGQRTLRNSLTRVAYPLKDASGADLYKLDGLVGQGGRPVNVSLISKNGINAAPNTSLGEWNDTEGRWDVSLYLEVNGDTVNPASKDRIYSKYYNNKVTVGETVLGSTIAEDSAALINFDLAGMGTVIHNNQATAEDNLLAQIIGGKDAGYTTAGFMGFMPNGQMTVFRTGGGTGLKDIEGTPLTGGYVISGGNLSNLTLFGKTMTVEITSPVGNDIVTFTATEVLSGGSTETPAKYNGYIGADGLLYIDSGADGKINQAYGMNDGVLTQVKEQGPIDYLNYSALRKSLALWGGGDLTGGRSLVDIIANASVVPALRSGDGRTISDVLSLGDKTRRNAGFITFVNDAYNVVDNDDYSPGIDAQSFFTLLGSGYSPLVVFSTGAYDTGNSSYLGRAQEASFENAAPLTFDNLEHLFMSVVAVGVTNGTADAKNVSGYSPSSSYTLAQWRDTNGTPDNAADDKYYKARVCGTAGRGAEGIDPWCFAAAGITDELAVASAAGAAGAVKSAFSYLNNKQLFALLALTADGPFLGTDSAGAAFTKDGLRSYLKGLYTLPSEYNVRWESGAEDYLDVFKEVFGYGLINIDRATTPTTKIYYYNGDKIVSAPNNAYWRSAASRTAFRPSSALNLRAASISAPFFDVLESVDGTLRLPRVWENEISLSSTGKRGLYMGDVLGDLRTRAAADNSVQIRATRFSMSLSERAYNDNMSGLDNMSLSFAHGNWNFGAGYQHYLTDGLSKFSGMPNPILSLASNAVSSDVRYRHNNWTFGARAFSGAITDEGLLENDPTVSAQFAPARLGLMRGGEMSAGVSGAHAGLDFAFGYAGETDTVLGAMSDGLLGLGNGRTIYADVLARYNLGEKVRLSGRATFARTMVDATGGVVLGLSDIESDAFAVALDAGNLSLTASLPLAVRRGEMQYAYAHYDVVDADDGNFDLVVRDAGRESLDLRPAAREMRFAGTYRHSFGEFTDGAVGFIYRVHPNNTDEFGNESIFMIKMSHRLGI